MDSDIIVLVIAVVASVISAAVKGKKSVEVKKVVKPQSIDDPWKEIATEPVVRRKVSATSPEQTYPAENAIENHSSVRQRKTNVEQSQRHSSPADDILEDFSIEKAVLYSEILNPKYKEL